MTPSCNDSQVLFERWYVTPLRVLETIPNGDGAFVAFAIALSLYERFARAALNAAGERANDQALIGRLAQDFGISEAEAGEFWQIMRHGMQHQAMPMQRQQGGRVLTPWVFSHVFPRPVSVSGDSGRRVLQVQPWLFRDVVLRLYSASPEMIDLNDSFPWASIFPLNQPR